MDRLTDKRMKVEGFIPVDPKEYKAFVRNEKPSSKQIYKRLLEIEDILGDEYDLERLKVLVNQRMTMREEVAERFSITKYIPVDRLRELVEADKDGQCIIVTRCCECKNHSDVDGEHYCKFWRMYCPDDSEFYCKAAKPMKGESNGTT